MVWKLLPIPPRLSRPNRLKIWKIRHGFRVRWWHPVRVKIDGDRLIIKMVAALESGQGVQNVPFEYEGKLPKPGAKKIFGSVLVGNRITIPVTMEATSAKSRFELDREVLQKTPTDPRAVWPLNSTCSSRHGARPSLNHSLAWSKLAVKRRGI